jgi:hypothetical protein
VRGLQFLTCYSIESIRPQIFILPYFEPKIKLNYNGIVRIAIFLFIFCSIIYFTIPNSFQITDTLGTRLIPISILSGDGIYLDRFIPGIDPQIIPNFLRKSHGHYISNYPILSGLIAVPFYLPMFFLNELHRDPKSLYLISAYYERLSAAIIASISVTIFYLLFKQMTKKSRSSIFFYFNICLRYPNLLRQQSTTLATWCCQFILNIVTTLFTHRNSVNPEKKDQIFFAFSNFCHL